MANSSWTASWEREQEPEEGIERDKHLKRDRKRKKGTEREEELRGKQEIPVQYDNGKRRNRESHRKRKPKGWCEGWFISKKKQKQNKFRGKKIKMILCRAEYWGGKRGCTYGGTLLSSSDEQRMNRCPTEERDVAQKREAGNWSYRGKRGDCLFMWKLFL